MTGSKRNVVGGGVATILVVACMLLCTLSPAIMTWNEDFVYADDGEGEVDVKYYVSIGDSTVNGYGMPGYYGEGGTNYSGYLQEVEGAYPYKVREALGEDWDLIQLATSAMRMDDLALMLGNDVETREYLMSNDYYFNRVYDMHRAICDSDEFRDLCDCPNAGGETDKETVLECVQEHYQYVVSTADLISIGLGMNNFGTYLTMSIDKFIKGKDPFSSDYYYMDFTGYPGITAEMVTYAEGLMDDLIELLKLEMGITGDEPIPGTPMTTGKVIEFIEFLAKALVYEYIGFIVYFDWSIEKILEINPNPDLNIVVVDLYRSLDGISCTFDGMEVPLATVHNFIIDSANVYTKNISKWAYDSRVLHADLEESPDILIHDIRSTADPEEPNSAGYTAAQSSALVGLLTSFGQIETIEQLVGIDAHEENCTVGLREHYDFVDSLYKAIPESISAFQELLISCGLPPEMADYEFATRLGDCETIDEIREISIYVFENFDEEQLSKVLVQIESALPRIEISPSAGRIIFMNRMTPYVPDPVRTNDRFVDSLLLCRDTDSIKSLAFSVFAELDTDVLENILYVVQNFSHLHEIKELIDTVRENFDAYVDATDIELTGIFSAGPNSLDEPGTMRLFIQTLLSNGVYQHPNGDGYDILCDAIVDAYVNKDNSKDFPFSIYDEYLKNGGFEGLVSDLETSIEEIRVYLEQLKNSPQYLDLQAKFDTFIIECNELLAAIESGVIDAVDEAIRGIYTSYSELKTYVLALANEFFDSEMCAAFIADIEQKFYVILGYIDAAVTYVQAAIDSVDWTSIGPTIIEIAEDLCAKFVDSPFYDVLVAKMMEIEADLKEKYDALMIAISEEFGSLQDVIVEFNKAVEAAIANLEQFLIDLGEDVDAALREAIEMAIAAYDAVIVMIGEFIDQIQYQIAIIYDEIKQVIDVAIDIIADIEKRIEDLKPHIDAIIGESEDVILAVGDATELVGNAVIAIPGYVLQGMSLNSAIVAADIPGKIEELKVKVEEVNREIQDLYVYMDGDLVEIIKLKLEVINSFIALAEATVLDMFTYEEQDDAYFYNGLNLSPLYIGGAVEDDSEYGDLLGLRLMDIVELMGGTESDGLVPIYESIDMYALYTDIAESSLVVIETDSGNIKFLLNDLIMKILSTQYPALAPADLDFSRYDGLVGTSVTGWLNDFENNVEPIVEQIALLYPGNDEVIDLLEFLVERVAYAYLGTFSSMVESEMIVHAVNPFATVLFTGAYNPFEGMYIDLGEATIPLGVVFDSLTPVFDRFVSEYCEDTERTVFVGLSDVETKISSFEVLSIDVLFGFLSSGLGILEPTAAGYQQIGACVDSVIDGLGCVQTHYFITFVDEDGTVLQKTLVEYGELPEYAGDIPEKDADDQYTYTFAGWDPEVVEVVGEATYTATYAESLNRYTVTWIVDGVETEETYEYGAIPEFDVPTKPATAQYTYTFAGWSPEVVAVTGDATYTAVFESTVNKYTVTWIVDGVETEETYEYGAIPEFDVPTKPATAQYSYTFAGWTPEVVAVTGDATYTAVFESSVNEYTVTWKDYDGSVIKTEQVAYGTVPVYTGDVPTKAATAQYTYTFAGWDPEVVAVTGDATYIAQFDEIVNEYTVTWKNYDGSVIKTEQVAYGTVPVYSGDLPSKPATAQYTYTFAGWAPELVAVTGDAIYTAEFYENAVIISADDNEAKFVVDDIPETVDNVIIRTDVWEVTVPDALLTSMPAGAEVSISVNILTEGNVPGFVQTFAGEMEVIVLNMAVNGESLSDFGTEKITVSLNFVPKAGMDVSRISVYYLNEDRMALEEHPAFYDAENSVVVFETSHFSYWFVGESSAAPEAGDSDHDIPVAILILLLMLLALCGAIMRLER